MRDKVSELSIVDDSSCIFTRGDRYEIPLYQRPYAWGEQHIEQLIDDVGGLSDNDQTYYLGSLVVARKGDKLFEVIDGQQRLTTLYLLLFALGVDLRAESKESRAVEGVSTGVLSLSFSCREKSDYTIARLENLSRQSELDEKRIEANIESGLAVIRDKLSVSYPTEEKRASLLAKLARTRLYRIEVPEHTDLNHYFEIMNTRGEQLEQHEVLKAWLMEPLSGEDAIKFSRIWDACSDMSCYVQMRFDLDTRVGLFGWWFDWYPSTERIRSVVWGSGGEGNGLGIREIVGNPGDGRSFARSDKEPSRFESIIDFRFFLLHVLKIFVRIRGIESIGKAPLVASILDDKKLGEAFRRVAEEGVQNGEPIDREKFSQEFVECLLQTRFLFDKCIIKREFVGGDLEGAWSLKELHRESKNRYHYLSSKFKRAKGQWNTTLDKTNRTVLMIQSCLRVSYTSPKVMHWITELLAALMDDTALAGSEDFARHAEDCAKGAVREFLDAGNYELGVNTPHVVFNYLDFLLWQRNRTETFAFEFRTSIEHWYPQHPSDDTFERWDEVDRFGNLCLVQRNVNSKFSNLSPLSKKSTYRDMIAKGSLKLREMERLTGGGDEWKGGVCQRHEEEMLRLLREACR